MESSYTTLTTVPEVDEKPLLDSITNVMPMLLNTLTAFENIQRQFHPPRFQALAEYIRPFGEKLHETREQFKATEFPQHLKFLKSQIDECMDYALRACDGVMQHADGLSKVMRSTRALCRAQESLYPLGRIMTPVSQYFLEASTRNDTDLIKKLQVDESDQKIGIMNVDNDRKQRGGFSLYVPEYYVPEQAMPLVVALHGGSGHGADFLWNWLREARTRGFILISPTSSQNTWPLMGVDNDSKTLFALVDYVNQNWSVDSCHVLLTGMSDGATYTLLHGLEADVPYTHLASLSGVLHPDNFVTGNIKNAKDKKIYLVHGTLDWMFPIDSAHWARDELSGAGADLRFREIEDLSHNYARGENAKILEWFDPALALDS